MSAQPILYIFQACPYAQRSRMTLLEKGIDHEIVVVDPANRPANFREISPYGKVPVLLHGEGRVYESAIINEYLEESFTDVPLLPREPLARAQARIWMDYCDSKFLPVTQKMMRSKGDADVLAGLRPELDEVLRFMEAEVFSHGGPWFMGEDFSLVDIHFMPFFERFPAYTELWGAEIPDDCERLLAWMDRSLARPAVAETGRPADEHIAVYRRLMGIAA